MNIDAYWFVIAGVIAAAVIGYILVKRSKVRSAQNTDLPDGSLPPGWQFYSNPTTLEPPGTVYCIDPQGIKFIVDELKVPIHSGEEATGTVKESVDAKTGIAARFMGMHSASMEAQKTERFEFGITDVVKEYTMNAELDKIMSAFLDALDYQKGYRYFIIREARKASAIRFKLSKKQVDSFGGETTVGTQVKAQGNVFSSDNRGQYVIDQRFKAPMRVMFLPQEIKVVTAGLAAEKPRLGLMPVKEPLYWEEAAEREN